MVAMWPEQVRLQSIIMPKVQWQLISFTLTLSIQYGRCALLLPRCRKTYFNLLKGNNHFLQQRLTFCNLDRGLTYNLVSSAYWEQVEMTTDRKLETYTTKINGSNTKIYGTLL